jgi:hypothetical protein
MQQRGITQAQLNLLLTFGTKARQKGNYYVISIRGDLLDKISSCFHLLSKNQRHAKTSQTLTRKIAKVLQSDNETLSTNTINTFRKDVEGLHNLVAIVTSDLKPEVVTTFHQHKKVRTLH